MVGLIYFGYELFKGKLISRNILGIIICSTIFIILVIYHGTIKEKVLFSQNMIRINEDYLKRISGKWTDFKDMGEEFIDREHPYSFDLDLVGKKSLFQMINVTNTFMGRENLVKALLFPKFNAEEIRDRQEAVEELAGKIDFCQNIEYIGRSTKIRLQSPLKLLNYMEEKSSFIKSTILKRILYFIPMVTIPFALVVFAFGIDSLKQLVSFVFTVQLIIWLIAALKLNARLGMVGEYKNTLEEYLKILKVIENEEFTSKKMKQMKENLFHGKSSAITAIKNLYYISEKINVRTNGILYVALNILFLWDYQCIFSLEGWKEANGANIKNWLNEIGILEELISISVFSHINEKNVFPEITDGKPRIIAKALGHPLITIDTRVNNDVELENNIFIITGSNMSGKTTFLRTIGINLVLAYAGGKICGEYMSTSIMEMYTSMRITDDLQEGISTFYGELIRIKEIIKAAEMNSNLIFLIDEIFRGTNSRDRITGAEAVIKHLNKSKVIGAITTHDLELCALDNSERIKNYHFEEHYENNKILFDYKLRKEKSKTTNAKYLMRIVGIELEDN